MESARSALVIKSTGSWYTLRDDASGQTVTCRIRGNLRLKGSRTTNPVVVGDRVEYEQPEGATGVVTKILPRRNYIIRRASNLSKESHIIAANVDQAFLVVSLFLPSTNCEFIDRFLVTAEAYRIPVTLLLNKCDLYATDALQDAQTEFLKIYRSAGYEVIELSATQQTGIDAFKKMLPGKTSLLSGNSGVGKSTLIRAIDPSLDIRIGAVSASSSKGKHTTTFSEMYPLAGGGYLIDTPGIKGFGLIDIENDEICRYFPDLFRYAPRCGYYNCTHTHDPTCAVREALRAGEIGLSRYESYLKLLDDDQKYRK